MEIDPSTLSRTEEEKRQAAESVCANAVAYEVHGNGVEWLSIKPTTEGPTRHQPSPVMGDEVTGFELAVCRLAGLAWDVALYDDKEMRLQAQCTIDGALENVEQPGFKKALCRVESPEQLEEAWSEAKTFVRDWGEVIKHAARRVMANFEELDDPILEGREISRLVNNPSAYDLETP